MGTLAQDVPLLLLNLEALMGSFIIIASSPRATSESRRSMSGRKMAESLLLLLFQLFDGLMSGPFNLADACPGYV